MEKANCKTCLYCEENFSDALVCKYNTEWFCVGDGPLAWCGRYVDRERPELYYNAPPWATGINSYSIPSVFIPPDDDEGGECTATVLH